MRKSPVEYIGFDITKDVISEIKRIAQLGYCSVIADEAYSGMNDLEDLARDYDAMQKDIVLILGEDWFLTYRNTEAELDVFDWISSKNPETELVRSLEMYKELKRVFSLGVGKKISAVMRHDTSYQLYLEMISKGYASECSNLTDVDGYMQPEGVDFLNKKHYSDLNFVFTDEDYAEFKPYETHIIHTVSFKLTNKAINKLK